jgi:cholesterol oxidase
MAQLSSHLGALKDSYTVVVIGSGYGAAIAASRLARAGQSVCVLERGKEFQPGEYPDTMLEAATEVQADAPEGHVGSRSGLYDFHVNEDINVFKGCGLGGTSLVNANVSLRAEPRVFQDPRWPAAFRADVNTRLESGYRRAEEMLKPNPYPADWPALAKLSGQETSAAAMKQKMYRLPINVNFTVDGTNHVGVEQKPCNLCGDCVTGCNHGAKNTLIMNYLPDAHNHGAHIFTQMDVRYLEKDGDGWRVYFQPIGTGREKFDAPTMFVRAQVVVIGGGALGSTEILLRSRAKGLATSDRVGRGFTGNGDVLGFAWDTKSPMNAIGFGHHNPEGREPVGPCISSVIDMREQPVLEDGMVLEEGSAPGALAPIVSATLVAAAQVAGDPNKKGILAKLARLEQRVVSMFEGAYHGPSHRSQIYLVMTHDDAGGKFELVNDRLRIGWPGVGSQPIFKKVDERLKQAAEALGGLHCRNPTWSALLRHPLITVHPLGGCPMGEDASSGAVNHKGQVFSSSTGTDVYPNLYVSDGAVMPRALGVNPLLTISAVAERCAALLAEDRGWTIDYSLPSRAPEAAESTAIGIQFTETMRGYLSTRVLDDYLKAEAAGKEENGTFAFTLTIRSDNLDDMLEKPEHAASIVGTVQAPALSPEPLTVTEGVFQLFVRDPEHVRGRRMVYRMVLTAADDTRYAFDGYKLVNDDHGADIWPDTSTLYITVRKGTGENDPVVGKGILHIEPKDFAVQMTTLKVLNAPGRFARLKATVRFGSFFAGKLWNVYGSVLEKATDFTPNPEPRKRRPLRMSAPELHHFNTDDGAGLLLTRFQGGTRGPVILAPGFGTSALAYTIDTTETNLPEYLFAHGYDVWVLDYRSSPELPVSKGQFTVDDIAKHDWPAAVRTVQQVSGAPTVQVVGHCVGSMSFLMAQLAGLQGVRSAVCSQLTLFPDAPVLTDVKASMHMASGMFKLGLKDWETDANSRNLLGQTLDKIMRLFPTKEGCTSAVCRRILFLYGEVYHHANLNNPTHEALHEMFGEANLTTLRHLTKMIHQGKVVDADGKDTYLPNVARLAMPVAFIHGAINRMFLPSGSQKTYDFLREKNGDRWYTRTVIPGYSHMDCFIGRDAVKDVYPVVMAELDKTN